jgi:hypothetical protein
MRQGTDRIWAGGRAALTSFLLCLLLASLGASPAHANYDPLGSGSLKLSLDPSFAHFLTEDEVKLSGSEGATRKGQSLLLSIDGGHMDPTEGKGQANAEGTLTFSNRRKQVPLREIKVKAKPTPLIAKVGGGQLKIASSKKTSAKRAGFGTKFHAPELTLTAKVATRLNKKLRPRHHFYAGQPLGKLTLNAQPQLATIQEGGRATLVFDSAFAQKLASRYVALNPIHPAEHVGTTFTMPIARGGQLAPDGSEGTLRTGGVIEALQLGAGQVFWQELWLEIGSDQLSAEVDLEPTPSFPGKLGRIGILSASSGVVSSDPKARTISISGIALTLQPATADALNAAFAQNEAPVFAAGEAVGVLGFVAEEQ